MKPSEIAACNVNCKWSGNKRVCRQCAIDRGILPEKPNPAQALTDKSPHLETYAKARKGNKHHAVRSGCAQGHVHDSGLEASRCDWLYLMKAGGEDLYGGKIIAIENQPVYPLHGRNGGLLGTYRADFAVTVRDADGIEMTFVEDAKGVETDLFKWKRKAYDDEHRGNPLRVVRRVGSRWVTN